MDAMKEITLPSGAILRIQVAPFALSRALYQAMLEETKGLKFDAEADIDADFLKNIFCVNLSSKKIEKALWDCMGRCLYNGFKITEETFEPVAARDDYLTVCFEVSKENVAPFMKSLYAKYSHILAKLISSPA